MGLFSGVGSAKANFGANYEREGHYYMFIRAIKKDKNRNNVEFVAVEKVCLKVINVEGVAEPHRVGEQLSHLLMSDKDPFLGNIKAMVSSVMGCNPDEVDEDACDVIVGDSQPMSCRVVEMQNKMIMTKPKPGMQVGTPFTLVGYKRSLTADEVRAAIPMETLQQFLSVAELQTVLEDSADTEEGEEE